MSVAAGILFSIKRLKILMASITRLSMLLQFPKSPFFGSLIIVPVFQTSGVPSSPISSGRSGIGFCVSLDRRRFFVLFIFLGFNGFYDVCFCD